MSRPLTTTVNVQILDKEFLINCPEEQRDELIASARLLDQRMRQVKHSGKVYGLERIAVMTALNLAHELLQLQRDSEQVDRQARELTSKLEQVLNHDED
ncbi:cell division protein ZapA [Balneatrix alpica]|uniref:Cell division protein ZapA n=1 Tax=Balneatrix alpica TaxID=75684 RepID=A0ABV5ZGU5_9GAMM|nr:cell division protein ZapA [Balneatrix alpica]